MSTGPNMVMTTEFTMIITSKSIYGKNDNDYSDDNCDYCKDDYEYDNDDYGYEENDYDYDEDGYDYEEGIYYDYDDEINCNYNHGV